MSRVHVLFDERGEVVEYELRAAHYRPELAPEDAIELAALCGIAWERRGESDFRDCIETITDWHDRRRIRALERRQRSRAAVLQLLQETNPQPRGGRRA